MKLLNRQCVTVLILCLIILRIPGKAQFTDQEATAAVEQKSFELSTYMGANRTVNLMLLVHQIKGVTLKIKDADDKPLHELYAKKSPKAYHFKLNFEGSQSGVYKLEISDGRKILVRQIEVVDIPATEAQRYVTFNAPVTQ